MSKSALTIEGENNIEKAFRDADGKLSGCDDDGVFVLERIIGWCGCGSPERAAEAVLNALELLDELGRIMEQNNFGKRWKRHQAAELKFLPDEGLRQVMYYVLAKADLTEHGGSVPGWLTKTGREVLDILRRWKNESCETGPKIASPREDDSLKYPPI